MTILVYEPVCHSLEHAQFNASILSVLAAAYPAQPIIFCAEESHISGVRTALPGALDSSFRFEILDIPARDLRPIRRFGPDLRNALKVFRLSRWHSSRLTVMTSTRESVLLSFTIASVFYAQHRVRRRAIIHMEMRKIRIRSRNPLRRCFDFVASLRYAAAIGIRYWVLEESIKKEAVSILPALGNWLRVLPHPIVQRKLTAIEPGGPTIKLGFLGMTTKKKGFEVFARLAEKTKSYGCLSYHVIGMSADSKLMQDKEIFSEGPFKERIPIKKYEDLIARLHYICVFLDSDRYRLSASGTLLDALSFQKPIIALRIPIIEDLCDRYGDIGYICNDEGEVQSVLSKLCRGIDSARYLNQAANLRKLVYDRRPEALATIVRADLESSATSGNSS